MVSGEHSKPTQQETTPEPMATIKEQEGDKRGSTEDEDQDNVKDPGELPAEAQLADISGNSE
jgi:hypothetical protein